MAEKVPDGSATEEPENTRLAGGDLLLPDLRRTTDGDHRQDLDQIGGFRCWTRFWKRPRGC